MTVIDDVVSPVDHKRLVPVALNKELPQLSVTVTVGVDGSALTVTTTGVEDAEQPLPFV